ncbi:hypothetical protein L6452_02565 [Arctium lappa]|uniref:Uncharacterized protein n=1 Tax=Arctium lappa TaxID=4217 RepID=A0ACB9FL15_ARCLA|nr:hypothetical protein L6452_02565 [Arctium lappa]
MLSISRDIRFPDYVHPNSRAPPSPRALTGSWSFSHRLRFPGTPPTWDMLTTGPSALPLNSRTLVFPGTPNPTPGYQFPRPPSDPGASPGPFPETWVCELREWFLSSDVYRDYSFPGTASRDPNRLPVPFPGVATFPVCTT